MSPNNQSPPEKAKKILLRLTAYRERFGILEEMDEVFQELAKEKGYRRARYWYWQQCLAAIINYPKYVFVWSFIMIKSYFKSCLRGMLRQKIFSIVNILGLSLGLACCVLIYLFVVNELSFDRFHENADSIYGVVCRNEFHDSSGLHTTINTGLVMKQDFPEIKDYVRLNELQQAAVRYKDVIFNERPKFTDANFFQVFSFPLLIGDPTTVLQAENSVVLAESTAEKYFGKNEYLGKTLSVTFGDIKKDFFVSGVCKDPPPNSSINFEMLLNINNLRNIQGQEYMTNQQWFDIKTFVLLHKGSSPDSINLRFPSFLKKHYKDTLQRWRESGSWTEEGEVISFRLENIKDIHLNPLLRNIGSRSIQSSLILTGIAILILIIACINFINLSIGRASVRSLEAGMRKVLGAHRKHLIHQFWAESLVLTFFAMLSGILIARMSLPLFNRLAGKDLQIGTFFTLPNLLIFFVILIVVGIASGSFPGLVFSKVDPVAVMKAKVKWGRKSIFSQSLIITQFSLAVFLIIVSFSMARQFRYINKANLGFKQEGLVSIDLQESDFEFGERTERIIERIRPMLKGNTAVKSISGSIMGFNQWLVMSHIDVKGTTYDVFFNKVYYDYIKTMDIKLLEGRDFTRDFSLNVSSVLVNQSFVKKYGFEDPIGKVIYDAYERDKPLSIIGVVEDFHFQSLKYEISPLIMHMIPKITIKNLLVRISLDNVSGTIKELEKAWKSVLPDKPFLFSFVDQNIQDSYDSQKRWNTIINISTVLALFISCMGIFALTVINITRRIKEIGIRRVLGAGARNIIWLIGKEFVILVAIANVFAWPLAYFTAKKWLQGFAYRISIAPDLFVFAFLLSLLISMSTVGALSLKAILSHPAQSLHSE